MAYVIQSVYIDRCTGKEYASFFKGTTMFGEANSMAGIQQAKRFDTKKEATAVKKGRFGSNPRVTIIKVDD